MMEELQTAEKRTKRHFAAETQIACAKEIEARGPDSIREIAARYGVAPGLAEDWYCKWKVYGAARFLVRREGATGAAPDKRIAFLEAQVKTLQSHIWLIAEKTGVALP